MFYQLLLTGITRGSHNYSLAIFTREEMHQITAGYKAGFNLPLQMMDF